MTMAAETEQPPRRYLDMAAIGLVIVLCVGIFWYFTGQKQYTLRNSANGFDGLRIWLSSEGQTAQSFTGGWPLNSETIGLLVQPVFDTRLDSRRVRAATREEILAQPDEFDQNATTIREKSRAATSLIVLPKWRSGLRLTGIGHPELQVPLPQVQNTLHLILGPEVGSMHVLQAPFSDFEFASENGPLVAQIYAAQVFDGTGCDPVIGESGALLLGLCPLPGRGEAYVLSDPDLLNNHGLRLGDNARIVAMLLPKLAEEQRIVIDYSTGNWLTEPDQIESRTRSWEDLSRLFDPPLRILWVGAALLLGLAIWRGSLRNGPVDRPTHSTRVGNRSANLVRARLMRLTDQDGALLADYVKARIQVQAAATLGPALPTDTAEEEYLRYVRMHSPELAEKLDDVVKRIRGLPAHLDAAEAIEHVDRFELTLEQIVHDA